MRLPRRKPGLGDLPACTNAQALDPAQADITCDTNLLPVYTCASDPACLANAEASGITPQDLANLPGQAGPNGGVLQIGTLVGQAQARAASSSIPMWVWAAAAGFFLFAFAGGARR